MVVFVTGQCSDSCYYCPVSEERFGKDRQFANEKEATSLEDYVMEAYRMNALGAGITGGDPLLSLNRTILLIEKLKEEFGSGFHVHLYTSGRYATRDALLELKRAGLDEIRFHPTREEFLDAVERAVTVGLEVGLEVPALPGDGEKIVKLAKWAEEKGVKFININELELNERNSGPLNSRGLRISHGLAGASGSYETALFILQKLRDSKLNVHYCSSVYKDVVETRTRFIRIGRKDRKPYEEVNGEGLLVKLFIRTTDENSSLEELGEKTEEGYYVSQKFLEDIRKELGTRAEIWLIEEMPDAKRLKVSERKV